MVNILKVQNFLGLPNFNEMSMDILHTIQRILLLFSISSLSLLLFFYLFHRVQHFYWFVLFVKLV